MTEITDEMVEAFDKAFLACKGSVKTSIRAGLQAALSCTPAQSWRDPLYADGKTPDAATLREAQRQNLKSVSDS